MTVAEALEVLKKNKNNAELAMPAVIAALEALDGRVETLEEA